MRTCVCVRVRVRVCARMFVFVSSQFLPLSDSN